MDDGNILGSLLSGDLWDGVNSSSSCFEDTSSVFEELYEERRRIKQQNSSSSVATLASREEGRGIYYSLDDDHLFREPLSSRQKHPCGGSQFISDDDVLRQLPDELRSMVSAGSLPHPMLVPQRFFLTCEAGDAANPSSSCRGDSFNAFWSGDRGAILQVYSDAFLHHTLDTPQASSDERDGCTRALHDLGWLVEQTEDIAYALSRPYRDLLRSGAPCSKIGAGKDAPPSGPLADITNTQSSNKKRAAAASASTPYTQAAPSVTAPTAAEGAGQGVTPGIAVCVRPAGASVRGGCDIDTSPVLRQVLYQQRVCFDGVRVLRGIAGETVHVKRLRIVAAEGGGWVSLSGRTLEDHAAIFAIISYPVKAVARREEVLHRCCLCDAPFASVASRDAHAVQCLQMLS